MVDHPPFHEIVFRVRYAETDQMGFVHHSNYPVYFEMGRTEMLRTTGLDYKTVEEQGFLLVIAKLTCRFIQPAKYDDELKLRTSIKRITYVRIEHKYELYRGDDLICEGETTLACVDRDGSLTRLPPELGPTS